MRFLIFLKANCKKLTIISSLIVIVNIIGVVSIDKSFEDYFKYTFPNQGLITNQDVKDSEVITNYSFIETENANENVRGIDLANLKFLNENSNSMKRQVQERLNNGQKSINQNFVDINDSYLFNQYKINIPLQSLDFDHLVVGKYPVEGEVLISEAFATNLINENVNYQKYEDLIGQNIMGYIISGVYNSSNLTESDEIILFDPLKSDNTLNFILDETAISKNEDNDEYFYITSKTYSHLNVKWLSKIILFVISILIFIYLIKNEIISFWLTASHNNVKKNVFVINVAAPITIIIFLLFLIFQI